MKKLLVVILSSLLVYGASAQTAHVAKGTVYVGSPRVIMGYGFYPGFYYPYGFYGAYGPYYPYYGVHSQPSKLQRQEEDIKSDYSDRIYSVRHDNSLTGKQKKENVRSLKNQRNKEIDDLVANYHKQPKSQPANPPSSDNSIQ